MTFDEARWMRHMRVREKKSRVTVGENVRKLNQMRNEGFDLERFLSSAEDAQDEGDAFLMVILDKIDTADDDSRFGFNAFVRVLKSLARYQDFERDTEWGMIEYEEPENRALSDDELAALLAYRDPRGRRGEMELRNRALVQFMLETGWRRNEIAALEMRDIDDTGERPYIHCRKPVKKGRKRWIPVSKELLSPRRPFGAWLKKRPILDEDPEAIWTTTYHGWHQGETRRMNGAGLYQAAQRVKKVVGLTEWNFRRARHTRGTLMFESGIPLRVIQQYLGHRSIESTVVYTQVRRGFELEQLAKAPSLYTRSRGEVNVE